MSAHRSNWPNSSTDSIRTRCVILLRQRLYRAASQYIRQDGHDPRARGDEAKALIQEDRGSGYAPSGPFASERCRNQVKGRIHDYVRSTRDGLRV